MGRRGCEEPLEVGDGSDPAILSAALAHYRERLWASDQAVAALPALGICEAVAHRFGVGLSDRSLGLRLPERNRKHGKAVRDALSRLGVYRSSGHEHFCGCLVVPVTAASGDVVALYGWRLSGDEPAELLAAGMPGGLFNASAVTAGELLVTDNVIDALAVVSAGHEAVMTPARLGGLSRADLELCASAGTVVLVGEKLSRAGEQLAGRDVTASLVRTGAPLHRLLAEAKDPAAALASLVGSARGARAPGRAPPPPAPAVEVTGDASELHVVIGRRRYRARGADRNKSPDALRISLSVTDSDSGGFHLDSLDLCQAKVRRAFTEVAAVELSVDAGVLRRELAEVLFAIEAAVASMGDSAAVPQMSEDERSEAMALLTDPDLAGRIVSDLHGLGVVGEETNLLCCYLATISRKAERPFGVVVQSSSAAGKSTLAEAVLSLVPEEDLVSYSAVTGQALYYLGAADLTHKVLAVAEERGAARASYALKLLLTEGRLSIASTGKDPTSGRLRTRAYEVTGPVALVLTTTATEVDPELENRLVTLGVDEDRAQTAAIQAAQRRAASLEGLVARLRRDVIVARHRNAQRLVEALPVVIGDTDALGFPDHATRHRRDHQKLLSVIAASALLHQHQRHIGTVEVDGRGVRYVEASADDVALATRLSGVITRGTDGLAPQTRRLLSACEAHVRERAERDEVAPASVAFTRRELREALGYTEHQVRVGLERLVALEYLRALPAGRGLVQRYVLAEASPGEPRDTSRGVRDEGSRGLNGSSATHSDHLARRVDTRKANETENVDVVASGGPAR